MIQLHSQHSLVIGRDGRRRSFHHEAVRAELVYSLRACGVRDVWVADHVLLVLEEQLLNRHAGGEGICEEDVDRLVTGILSAAGYGDVARAYEKRRGIDPLADWRAGLESYDRERLVAVLEELPQLPERLGADLPERVSTALAALGIEQASDTLIREIGLHFLAGAAGASAPGGQRGAAGDSGASRSDFLLDAAVLRHRAGLDDPAGVAEWARAVGVRPVSRQFPRICVDVHLERLCGETADDGPITELHFFPALLRLCRRLPEILTRLRSSLAAVRSDSTAAPAHLVIHGMERVLERFPGFSNRRARRAVEGEVRQVFAEDVAAGVDFELILTFR